MRMKGAWPLGARRLIRLSSFPMKVSALVLLLGGNKSSVEEHVNSCSRMFVQGGRQATKQAVESISHLADLLPKQKG
jgi:hypothetical protein